MTDILFWNVDTQYDFMRSQTDDDTYDGKLPVPGAEAIEDNLATLTDYAAAHDIPVVSTADWHDEETEEISYDEEDWDDPGTFPPHCMQGTKGATYVPATAPDDPYVVDWQDDTVDLDAVKDSREVVLYKDEFNVFTGTAHADPVLDVLDPDTVVVYGVATDVCVDFAVNGLLDRGYDVAVVDDAIAGLDEDALDAVKEDWQDDGATLFPLEELHYDDADLHAWGLSGHAQDQIETQYLLGEEDDAWLHDMVEDGHIPAGYALQLKLARGEEG